MDIILDTNVLRGGRFLLRARSFQLLFDFLEKTKSTFVMTQIVWEEILSLYEAEFGRSQAQLEKSRRDLVNLLPEENERLKKVDLDVRLQVEHYKSFLCKTLRFSVGEIVPYQANYLPELVARANMRRKPFTEKGEEFRDVLLWLTVLDFAATRESKTVVFISQNTHQYADISKKKAPDPVERMHPDLLQEASERQVSILYYSSIDDFLNAHSTTLKYVTKEWLISQLNQQGISDELIDLIHEYDEMDISDWLDSGDEFIGSAVQKATPVEIHHFFVYETADGSHFLIAVAGFDLEGSFDYEHKIRETEYEAEKDWIDGETQWVSVPVGYSSTTEMASGDFKAKAKVSLSALLKDESVERIHIEKWEIEIADVEGLW